MVIEYNLRSSHISNTAEIPTEREMRVMREVTRAEREREGGREGGEELTMTYPFSIHPLRSPFLRLIQ
jgi:hypothetical protein